MLRAQGVPTKLVVGYANGLYHAWNEVLVNEEGPISRKIESTGGWVRLDSANDKYSGGMTYVEDVCY